MFVTRKMNTIINVGKFLQNDLESAREVFDKFLSLYPYCYGYWRKYCDLLKKNNLQDECRKVNIILMKFHLNV